MATCWCDEPSCCWDRTPSINHSSSNQKYNPTLAKRATLNRPSIAQHGQANGIRPFHASTFATTRPRSLHVDAKLSILSVPDCLQKPLSAARKLTACLITWFRSPCSLPIAHAVTKSEVCADSGGPRVAAESQYVSPRRSRRQQKKP